MTNTPAPEEKKKKCLAGCTGHIVYSGDSENLDFPTQEDIKNAEKKIEKIAADAYAYAKSRKPDKLAEARDLVKNWENFIWNHCERPNESTQMCVAKLLAAQDLVSRAEQKEEELENNRQIKRDLLSIRNSSDLAELESKIINP